jgi:hypothetical protein
MKCNIICVLILLLGCGVRYLVDEGLEVLIAILFKLFKLRIQAELGVDRLDLCNLCQL